MADTKNKAVEPDQPSAEPDVPTKSAQAPVDEKTSAAESVRLPGIATHDNALIGDEAVNAEVHEVEVDVHTDSVPAQVNRQKVTPVEESFVHETYVRLDEVITDPNDPRAVQIPDAGRGSLELPIHRLDAGTPEDFFKSQS